MLLIQKISKSHHVWCLRKTSKNGLFWHAVYYCGQQWKQCKQFKQCLQTVYKHFILQCYLHFWWYFSPISQRSLLRHSWTLDQYQSRTLFCILSLDIGQGRQPDFNTSAQHLSFSLYFYATVVLSTSLYFTLLELWTMYSTIPVINIFICPFALFVIITFAPCWKPFFLKL